MTEDMSWKQTIIYWFNWLTNSDFRYQVAMDKYYAEHACQDCGAQDWAGYNIVGGYCDQCRPCWNCNQPHCNDECQDEGLDYE